MAVIREADAVYARGVSSAVLTRSQSRPLTEEKGHELVLTPPASRAITDKLPEAVGAAVIDFLTATLVAQPWRVGKPLRTDLAGIWSSRRGTYRVLYRLRESPREVIVVRIEHRRDAYRPR